MIEIKLDEMLAAHEAEKLAAQVSPAPDLKRDEPAVAEPEGEKQDGAPPKGE